MKCMICEKTVVVRTIDGISVEGHGFGNPRALPDDAGTVLIYCHYGSIHDQCDTHPYIGLICDECITDRKHLLDVQKVKVQEVWEQRKQSRRIPDASDLDRHDRNRA